MRLEIKTFTVAETESGMRLDRMLSQKFPAHSRSYFNKLIKNKYVLVNGLASKSGYILHADDAVDITFFIEKSDLTPAELPLQIVYEDADILVVNKAAGMAVHPGKGSKGDTLVNALLFHTRQLSQVNTTERPGIVHRLDKFTSGLLVIAKNDRAHRHLRRQFEARTIHRIYNALAWGAFKEQTGTVHTFIGRSRKDPTRFTVTASGKEAITHYKVLQDFLYVSFLEVQLDTGRTHQIRVHMKYLHHPLVGDETYNGRDSQLKGLPYNLQKRGKHLLSLLPHQALHAKKLTFLHPRDNRPVTFETELPESMKNAVDKLPQLFLLDE